MRTELVNINAETWVEITEGALTPMVQSRIAGTLLLHFSVSLTPPEDGEYHSFENYKGPLILAELGFTQGQRIWAKTASGAGILVVTRDVVGFETLEDVAANVLTTNDGLTLLAQEAIT